MQMSSFLMDKQQIHCEPTFDEKVKILMAPMFFLDGAMSFWPSDILKDTSRCKYSTLIIKHLLR